MENISISLATGGWSETAKLKLASADISVIGIPMASSDDHFDRTEIMKLAAARSGVSGDCVITYFGDGQWDKNASEKLGFNFILVGDKLKHQPNIAHFASINAVLACMGL
jgi:hypothetical protein